MPTDKRLYPLISCSVGVWSLPDKTRSYLLLLPEKKLFVILLTRELDVQGQHQDTALSLNGLLCWVRSYVSLWLRHKNPFVDHMQAPHSDTSVLTFEVAWADVVGMDFRWPLTDDARLVLETAHIAKRVFEDVEAVCSHYQPQPRGSSRRISLRQLAPTSSAAAAAVPAHAPQWQGQQQQQQPGTHTQPPPAPAGTALGTCSAASSSSTAAAMAGAAGSSTPMWASPASGSPARPAHMINKLYTAVAACDAGQQQPGSMSRVASWTSWASWTSGRSSMEQQTPTAAAAAAAAAAEAAEAAAAAAARVQGTSAFAAVAAEKQQQQQQQQQAGWLLNKTALQQQQRQQEHEPDAEPQPGRRGRDARTAAQQAAGSSLQQQQQPCNCSSRCLGSGGLAKAPTLEAGIAPGSLLTAALAAEQGAAHGGGSSSSCKAAPLLQELQSCASGSSLCEVCGPPALAPSVSPGTAAAAGTDPQLWPLCRGAAAAAASAAAMCVAETSGDSTAAAETAAAETAAAAAAETAAAAAGGGSSLGLWLRPIRLIADVIPAGCATAPCSMPSSPRPDAADEQEQQLLLQEIQQPLLQLYQQQKGQKMLQQQQQRRVANHSSGTSSSKASRARLAAAAASAAARSCPLCNQPLLQPLHVTQQRFHQRLEQQDGDGMFVRCVPRTGSSSRSARHAISKSRSACSLDQLLKQSKAAASSASSSCQASEQQQQQQPGSVKFRGAAAGSLAARCMLNERQAAAPAAAVASPAQPTSSAAAAGCPGSAEQGRPGAGVVCQDPAGPAADVAAVAAAAAAAAGHAPAAGTHAACLMGRKQAGPEAAAAAGSAAAGTAAVSGAAHGNGTVGAAAAAANSATKAVCGGKVVYSCRTMVMTFKDPTLPHQLRKIVNSESNVRLLKLYESGLPAWAVVLPSYGLWYRPWLRRVTWLLFVLLSVVSMAMGFYDLYKNVPYFKQAIVAMFSPAAAVFEWLEHHTQIRLSILLTYMLGKSQLLVQLLTLLAQTSLQPIIGPIAALLAPLGSAASAAAAALSWLAQPFVAAGRLLLLLLQTAWQLLSLLLWSGPLQMLGVLGRGVLALLQLLLLPLQVLLPGTATVRAGWAAAKATGKVARSAAPVVKGAAATASKAASSGWSLWGWGWGWGPFEALELMRVSTMRIMRALQAVVKFFVALGVTVNQHRLSLMLQLRQKLRGSLRAAAHSPAGRVASAVAVKMGQEARVARLQQRLQRSDSGLISVGSELLGHADSAAVGSALSLDGELLLGLGMGDELHGGARSEGSFIREVHGEVHSRAQSDSDEEVTSGVTRAPAVSPHRSSGGLRQRGQAATGSSGWSSARLGGGSSSFSRGQLGAALAAAAGVQAAEQGQQLQQLNPSLRSMRMGSGSSKQVTFANNSSRFADQQQQQQAVAAAWLHRHQSGGGVRWSIDAATTADAAAAKSQLGLQGESEASEDEQLLLMAAVTRALQSRAGSRSGSDLGESQGSWLAAAAAAAGNGSHLGPGLAEQLVQVGAAMNWQCHEPSQLSRSYDAGRAGVMAAHGMSMLGTGCVGAVGTSVSEGAAGAAGAAAHLRRRNSWG